MAVYRTNYVFTGVTIGLPLPRLRVCPCHLSRSPRRSTRSSLGVASSSSGVDIVRSPPVVRLWHGAVVLAAGTRGNMYTGDEGREEAARLMADVPGRGY